MLPLELAPSKNARVLIIDDEKDLADAMKLGLERNGIQVDAHNDPVEAIGKFKPARYDLVILDIRMPRMNGFDVYRELKRIDKDARICFLTAFEIYEPEFVRMFPDVKVQKFLKKPLTIGKLVEEIRGMVPERV